MNFVKNVERMEQIMFNHIPISTPILETAHFDGKHFYSIDGEKYPSITTILHSFPNPGIEIWKSKTPNWKEIQNESFLVGIDLHFIIEFYLKNMEVCRSDFAKSLFENLKPELDKIDNIQAQETRLYHKDLKVAGQVDLIGEYDGEKCIIDFKQSRRKKLEKYVKSSGYYLQLCGYANMFEYCCGQKIDNGVVLIANWDGSTSVHKIKIDDYQDDLEALIELYYNTENNR